MEGSHDNEGLQRWATAKCLGKIGPTAKAAIPALTKALEDEALVQLAAAEALEKIRGQQ